jgi:membrane protease YdiL (CAAX protease family)
VENWLQVHISTLLYGCVWLAIVCFIARRRGWATLPQPYTTTPAITIWNLLGAFAAYLGGSIVLAPLLFGLYFAIEYGDAAEAFRLVQEDAQTAGWMGAIVLLVGSASVLLLLLCLGKAKRRSIFFPGTDQEEKAKGFKSFFKGVFSWLLVYPWAIVVSQIVAIALYFFFNFTDTEQGVLMQLKNLRSYPVLFSMMVFCVICIVPIVEETLFRGFLMSWLKSYLGRWGSIGLSAVIFSTFHFLPSQGLGNIEIVLTLCVLGIFLGYLYEKHRCLWASIGLHSTFNAITMAMVIFFPSTA